MNLAVITARGGSKRIPRKNIKPFCGKPIIAYSIEAALNSKCFDEVMISTDDQEIAEIAKQYGAKLPFFRSEKNSSDFATTVDVLLEVASEYAKRGQQFSNLCCIYPTAPLISDKALKSGIDILNNSPQIQSAFPIVRFSFPIQRALRLRDQRVSFMNAEHANTRSQDLEPAYHDAGQFYWVRIPYLLEQKKIVGDAAAGIELPEWQVQDIDNLDDWKLAEMKYAWIQQKGL